ncbi:MAG: N-acetyltransferase [Flavobacterium sp.]|uniref:GNAT family N-acetyltransferase n=1 Tax=Flavobacterium sp. TaxID=239 RepID=UPI001225F554|nr:GNAT family N-acetyltransferase [Flavobacterium sp.]RZJ64342.1 MAG: N-acetyltransferase [Flavobacterium sp.]
MELIVNDPDKQFEFHLEDGSTAFIEFVNEGKKIYLTHTEVPASHQGNGIGTKLVEKVLAHIKQDKRVLVPLCSFVASYVNNHDEWHSILAEGYQM